MRVSTCHCAVGAVVCECLRATVPWVPSCASVCVPLCRCARVSACHCRFGCLNSLVLFGATRVYPAAFRGADLLARPLARTSTWMFPLRFAINIYAPLLLSISPSRPAPIRHDSHSRLPKIRSLHGARKCRLPVSAPGPSKSSSDTRTSDSGLFITVRVSEPTALPHWAYITE